MNTPRKYKLGPKRVDKAARGRLRRIVDRAQKANDLSMWKRARAVVGYIEDRPVDTLAEELKVDRSTICRWVAAYAQRGVPALKPGVPPGPESRLSDAQLKELCGLVKAGPEASGFDCGVWTARMIGELIRRRFEIEYHWKYVPELLHKLGFSVQRPRKQLSRADHKAQEYWLQNTFPRLKKKPRGSEPSSSSKTKPASSSTPRCTEPGLQ